jgi:hypothetical protein
VGESEHEILQTQTKLAIEGEEGSGEGDHITWAVGCLRHFAHHKQFTASKRGYNAAAE